MRTTFTMSLCAAVVGLLAWSHPALAQQKSTKQCNDEWSANKIAIQASGKTKKVFVAECRGATAAATKPRGKSVPSGEGRYATEADARTSCPTDSVVWVNLGSKVSHASSSRSYGKTKKGAYMCEKESAAAGFRASKVATRT